MNQLFLLLLSLKYVLTEGIRSFMLSLIVDMMTYNVEIFLGLQQNCAYFILEKHVFCFASCTAKCAVAVHVRRPTLMTVMADGRIFISVSAISEIYTSSHWARCRAVPSQQPISGHTPFTHSQIQCRVCNLCVFSLWETIGKEKNSPRHGKKQTNSIQKGSKTSGTYEATRLIQ